MVELLVVIMTIGILAAVAIPVFLSQRAKAHDTSTVADVTRLGNELATFYVDLDGVPTLDFTSVQDHVVIEAGAHTERVRLSNGTAKPASGESADLNSPTGWCVSLTDPRGSVKQYHYSARGGLGIGGC